MSKSRPVFISICIAGCLAFSPAGAGKAFAAASAWTAQRDIASQSAYNCTVSRRYNGFFDFIMTSGSDGRTSLTFDFENRSFSKGSAYPIRIYTQAGISESFEATALSANRITVTLGRDSALLPALQGLDVLKADIGSKFRALNVYSLAPGVEKLDACMALSLDDPGYGILTPPPPPRQKPSQASAAQAQPSSLVRIPADAPDTAIPVQPAAPVQRPTGDGMTSRIASLMAETEPARPPSDDILAPVPVQKTAPAGQPGAAEPYNARIHDMVMELSGIATEQPPQPLLEPEPEIGELLPAPVQQPPVAPKVAQAPQQQKPQQISQPISQQPVQPQVKETITLPKPQKTTDSLTITKTPPPARKMAIPAPAPEAVESAPLKPLKQATSETTTKETTAKETADILPSLQKQDTLPEWRTPAPSPVVAEADTVLSPAPPEPMVIAEPPPPQQQSRVAEKAPEEILPTPVKQAPVAAPTPAEPVPVIAPPKEIVWAHKRVVPDPPEFILNRDKQEEPPEDAQDVILADTRQDVHKPLSMPPELRGDKEADDDITPYTAPQGMAVQPPLQEQPALTSPDQTEAASYITQQEAAAIFETPLADNTAAADEAAVTDDGISMEDILNEPMQPQTRADTDPVEPDPLPGLTRPGNPSEFAQEIEAENALLAQAQKIDETSLTAENTDMAMVGNLLDKMRLLEIEKESLRKELASYQDGPVADITRVESQARKIYVLKTRLERLGNENALLQSELKLNKDKVRNLERTAAELEEQAAEAAILREQVESLTEQNEALRTKVTELDKEASQARLMRDEDRRRLDELRDIIGSMSSKLDGLTGSGLLDSPIEEAPAPAPAPGENQGGGNQDGTPQPSPLDDLPSVDPDDFKDFLKDN